MLQLPIAVYNQIRQHGEAAYPHESCGILIGHLTLGSRVATHAIPVSNTAGTPRNRYDIAPLDLIRIEREARTAGLTLLGFYHSHPDHPAHWSPTDLVEAHWLGCSYVIIAVQSGKAMEANSFQLAGTQEENKRFEPEEIVVIPEPWKPPPESE